MQTPPRLVLALRVLLALAFAVLLAGQLRVLPAVYDDWVRDAPELAGTGWLLTAGVLVLLCVQVVVVCTWRLLALVAADRIFSDDSFVWVNTIVGAIAAGWVLLAVAFGYMISLGEHAGTSGVLLLMLVGGAVLGLLMVVMRALLWQATTLRTEMEAVV